MDGLNNQERALAWLASWNPSFDGRAIVNPDFTFRAINQQFCDILGVSPAELVGGTFTDITPAPIRELEIKNANLVMQGLIQSYILEKNYEMMDGRKIDVTLLVNGVYAEDTKEFLFFVSTIMERKPLIMPPVQHQELTGLLEWVDKKKVGMTIFSGIVFLVVYLFNKYFVK